MFVVASTITQESSSPTAGTEVKLWEKTTHNFCIVKIYFFSPKRKPTASPKAVLKILDHSLHCNTNYTPLSDVVFVSVIQIITAPVYPISIQTNFPSIPCVHIFPYFSRRHYF